MGVYYACLHGVFGGVFMGRVPSLHIVWGQIKSFCLPTQPPQTSSQSPTIDKFRAQGSSAHFWRPVEKPSAYQPNHPWHLPRVQKLKIKSSRIFSAFLETGWEGTQVVVRFGSKWDTSARTPRYGTGATGSGQFWSGRSHQTLQPDVGQVRWLHLMFMIRNS